MQKLATLMFLSSILVVAPSSSERSLMGVSTSYAQHSVERRVKRICRYVWNRGRQILRCTTQGWRSPGPTVPNLAWGVFNWGPAGTIAGTMRGNRNMPHEWWPYRNRAEADYWNYRRRQLGRRHGPAYNPYQTRYQRARRNQLGRRHGPYYPGISPPQMRRQLRRWQRGYRQPRRTRRQVHRRNTIRPTRSNRRPVVTCSVWDTRTRKCRR